MNDCYCEDTCDRMDCRERGCIASMSENPNKNFRIFINKPVEVEPATLEIFIKIRDEFSFKLVDSYDNIIADSDGDYVPAFMPGMDSDYLDLRIDVKTGRILNWRSQEDFIRKLRQYIDSND